MTGNHTTPSIWARLRRSPSAMLGLAIVVGLILLAVIAPEVWGERATQRDFLSANQGPSSTYLLGTDALGRDILIRTLVATRLSLTMALTATAIGSGAGVIIGALLALSPARVRMVGARTIDGLLAFPSILMGIFVAAILGAGSTAAVLGIGIALTPQFARLTMNKALSLVSEDFVQIAEVMGVPRRKVVRRHLLPNIAESIGVIMMVTIGEATIAVSSLSFLGLGVVAPDFDWGQLLTEGIDSFQLTPYAALAPAVMITVTGVAASVLGDTLGKMLDPAAPVGERAARRRVGSPSVTSQASDASVREDAVVSVENLQVSVRTRAGRGVAVRDVSLAVGRGEMVGLVGESGSGKTLTALALAGLQPAGVEVSARGYSIAGQTGASPSDSALQAVQRRTTAFVFQDPMSSFNPLVRVGSQVVEAAQPGLTRTQRRALAIDAFAQVQISAPAHRFGQYPHELSGGMRQRAMIAGALMAEPDLIIADEPTTSLDVSTQAQIMGLLRNANAERGMAVLLISHDIALVAQNCTRIVVMYAGRIVEELHPDNLRNAVHPYTRALIAATPDLSGAAESVPARPGSAPQITEPDGGCAFANRCLRATDRCVDEVPEPGPAAHGGRAACWHPIEGGQP